MQKSFARPNRIHSRCRIEETTFDSASLQFCPMCDSLDCRRILILNWGPFLVISRSMFSFLSVCTFEQPNKIVITKLQLYIYNWYELNKSSVNWLQQTESFLAVIWITSFSSLVNILITNVVTSVSISTSHWSFICTWKKLLSTKFLQVQLHCYYKECNAVH